MKRPSPAIDELAPFCPPIILDEIHAVVGNKRGVHLITAIERLVTICGEFQRIGLSATIRPLEKVAEFLGGFSMKGVPPTPAYLPRSVTTIRTCRQKSYSLRILTTPLPANTESVSPDEIWEDLVGTCKSIIMHNRSTLLSNVIR